MYIAGRIDYHMESGWYRIDGSRQAVIPASQGYSKFIFLPIFSPSCSLVYLSISPYPVNNVPLRYRLAGQDHLHSSYSFLFGMLPACTEKGNNKCFCAIVNILTYYFPTLFLCIVPLNVLPTFTRYL